MTDLDNPFLYKEIRADERDYWAEFVENLMGVSTPLRTDPHKAFTSRLRDGQYEIVANHPKFSLFERQKKEAQEQGLHITKHSSASYANPRAGYKPKVFGHDAHTVSVGIGCDPQDALFNRIMLYDGGTIERPYESDSKESAGSFLAGKKDVYLSTLEELTKKGKEEQNKDKHNEVMARFKLDPSKNTFKIFIFADNMESRLLAQLRAQDLSNAIHKKYGRFPNPPIAIFFYESLQPYTEIDQQGDKEQITANPDGRSQTEECKLYVYLLDMLKNQDATRDMPSEQLSKILKLAIKKLSPSSLEIITQLIKRQAPQLLDELLYEDPKTFSKLFRSWPEPKPSLDVMKFKAMMEYYKNREDGTCKYSGGNAFRYLTPEQCGFILEQLRSDFSFMTKDEYRSSSQSIKSSCFGEALRYLPRENRKIVFDAYIGKLKHDVEERNIFDNSTSQIPYLLQDEISKLLEVDSINGQVFLRAWCSNSLGGIKVPDLGIREKLFTKMIHALGEMCKTNHNLFYGYLVDFINPPIIEATEKSEILTRVFDHIKEEKPNLLHIMEWFTKSCQDIIERGRAYGSEWADVHRVFATMVDRCKGEPWFLQDVSSKDVDKIVEFIVKLNGSKLLLSIDGNGAFVSEKCLQDIQQAIKQKEETHTSQSPRLST